ncbi:unnamed protein product [Cylicocyclus nassatus]|uniref:C2 domain-containing protein n=1 Tax=Cylicocyclus nassatus TaxID=53992 RepID=A0AA36M5Z0_CYLNA|nr:unnamed protein product [Cylicocyclus nassatus]
MFTSRLLFLIISNYILLIIYSCCMQRQRTNSLPSGRSDHECNNPELRFDQILTHFSFLRINIDSIILPQANELIERLYNEGSLYGFNLEYQFPCLESISKSLKAAVRIPAKSFTMTEIQFRHKRVVLLRMNQDIIPFWNRKHLILRLHVQLNTRGKFSTRLLAECSIPLVELLIPPFCICRDFNFRPARGMTFEGSALIRIDLGSRDRKLMETLKELRDPLLESTYVVHGVGTENVAESQRKDSASQTSENRPPSRIASPRITPRVGAAPFRERIPSNFTDTSDSVFEYPSRTKPHVQLSQRLPESGREFRPAIRSDTSSTARERERLTPQGKSFMQLTVHEARGLPPVQDERNRYVSPNTYVSVLGRDGELRSSICERSRRPLWNWTSRFYVCGERRNLLVKIFHRDNEGDKLLGFVSLPLPIEEAKRVDYEMVDLSGRAGANGEVPVLTMSMETYDRDGSRTSSYSDGLSASSRITSPHIRPFSSCSARETSPRQEPIITATREELAENLRRNIAELDRLMRNIK